ncbi:universal stress protein [Roseomonas alkaliterrae]|uniref:Nucleotide-binding universal stress UspA family protein n=1 Tax=Neoroseomonas alkaliterrae TaxID=1452450 RepID=A0A840XSR1_9PROT|nr:nucleotide-binding universal stress UspA family protein [Neoroseomonas alkaliterrae]MBR0676768.1 universal stress protein [Neoroseomonas alkaliterrae]
MATDLSSRADRAMRRAAIAAAARGAELLMLYAVDDDQPAAIVEATRREAAALLARAADGLPELRGLATRTLVEAGDPFDVILRVAEEQACDLIVLGEHRRRLLRDMLVGTTVERVIRLSRRPVLMVNALPTGPYRQVLAASDLGPAAAAMLGAAAATGLLHDAALSVLHARESAVGAVLAAGGAPAERRAEHKEAALRQAREELATFLAGLGHPALRGAEALAVAQPPVPAILGAVERLRPDLLVIGTRGAASMERAVLGSVAAEVLRQVGCDTLTIPAAG